MCTWSHAHTLFVPITNKGTELDDCIEAQRGGIERERVHETREENPGLGDYHNTPDYYTLTPNKLSLLICPQFGLDLRVNVMWGRTYRL